MAAEDRYQTLFKHRKMPASTGRHRQDAISLGLKDAVLHFYPVAGLIPPSMLNTSMIQLSAPAKEIEETKRMH